MNGDRHTTDEADLDPRLERDLRQLSEAGSEPTRDLWPEIREQIARPRLVWDGNPWARLAAGLLLFSILAAGGWWLVREPSRSRHALTLEARSASDLPPGSPEKLREIFESHLQEREKLLRLVARALEDYPPELRFDIRANIALMEGTMREIERSLADLPGDSADEMHLTSLYDRELRLLREVNARLRGHLADQE